MSNRELRLFEKLAFSDLVEKIDQLVDRGVLPAEDFVAPEEPYLTDNADVYAARLIPFVRSGKIGSRSPAADAFLEYSLNRFSGSDSIKRLEKHVAELQGRPIS